MLKIGSKIFDGIFSDVNRKKIETFTIWSATIGFVFHLSLVLLNNYSIIDIGNESLLLTNPISAIYTPFSIILYYEIFLLIFFLPRSFTTSILKQFEIISLIIITLFFIPSDSTRAISRIAVVLPTPGRPKSRIDFFCSQWAPHIVTANCTCRI